MQCLEAANKQFDDQGTNILVIVPRLRLPMYGSRRDLIKAAYGESVIAFDVNPEAGRLENHRWVFAQRGKFLNTKLPGGRPIKPDGLPAYRRIGAVLSIEEVEREKYRCPMDVAVAASLVKEGRSEWNRIFKELRDLYFSRDNQIRMDHAVLVLHNPNAYEPLDEDLFAEFPQLVVRDDGMVWTDGYEGFV
jgi:hypothetical protein